MSRLYYGSINFIMDSLKKEFPENQIMQVYDFEKQTKSINIFFDNDKIFLFIEPNNEQLKVIENFKVGKNFLYFENDNFDGRVSLIQKIKKNNSIFDFSFPVVGDFLSFKRQLINYLKTNNLKMSSECMEWLKVNCPLLRSKSKTTKKEELFYDLDVLFKEIEKISSCENEIDIEHFETSIFKTDDDIFAFIDKVLEGNIASSLSTYDKLKISMGEQGVLMITLYQIIFLINLIGSKNNTPFNVDKIIEKVELRDILGKYLDENWNETKFIVKTQNPMRIKIALSKYNMDINKLTKIFNILVDTIVNLRNNYENPIAGFIMINKVCNV